MVLFEFIDPQYVSNAETKIKHLFEGTDMKVNNNNYKEIAIIPKKKMDFVKDQYTTVGKLYIGHNQDLINQIKEKDSEILLMKKCHENELQKERYEKDLLKEKYENKLLKKDLEIANLKSTKIDKNKDKRVEI